MIRSPWVRKSVTRELQRLFKTCHIESDDCHYRWSAFLSQKLSFPFGFRVRNKCAREAKVSFKLFFFFLFFFLPNIPCFHSLHVLVNFSHFKGKDCQGSWCLYSSNLFIIIQSPQSWKKKIILPIKSTFISMIWYYSLVLEVDVNSMFPVSLHARSSEPKKPCYTEIKLLCIHTARKKNP